MSADLPKWAFQDPSLVAERIEEMARKRAANTRQERKEKAEQELKKLFEGKADEKQH